jgi:hypothetical protein
VEEIEVLLTAFWFHWGGVEEMAFFSVRRSGDVTVHDGVNGRTVTGFDSVTIELSDGVTVA